MATKKQPKSNKKVILLVAVAALAALGAILGITGVFGGKPQDDAALTATLLCPGAQAWSPDSPKLYEAEAVLWLDGEPADDLCDRFGFRQVETKDGQLLLNGEPIFIKGVNRHEDHSTFGSAIPVEAMVQDVQLIRDMGCNLVRTSHYPNDPRFLDLCDQYGLLVWEEVHARGLNLTQMQHPNFMDQTMLCLEEMVQQHRNHPSIILWGCLNECDDVSDEGAAIYRQCFDTLRRLDPSRPVTAAILDRDGSQVLADTDVASINLYPLWYFDKDPGQHIRDVIARTATLGGSGKPFLISEIGAGAIPGFHDPLTRPKWSEERQAEILRAQITAALHTPGVNGVIIWQYADTRVDEGSFANRPRTMNNKGLLDEHRRPKLAYAVVKELFQG